MASREAFHMSETRVTSVGKTGNFTPSTNFAGVFDYDSPEAIEVDADGVILPIAYKNGLTVVIPLWPNPAPEGKTDELYIYLDEDEVFYGSYTGPITQPEFRNIIDPKFLLNDGVVLLTYQTLRDGNPAYSKPRTLVVRRTPPVMLSEPSFPSATLWGYLNCSSSPKLWEALLVAVPVPTAVLWQENDELRLGWQGFSSLNGTGPALVSTEFTRVLTAKDVQIGYVFSITDYQRYVKPMERNASALAIYSIYRAGVLIGRSSVGLVKIDRTIPGEVTSCGPLGSALSSGGCSEWDCSKINGETTMTIDMKLNAVQQSADESRNQLRQNRLLIGPMADSPAPNIVGVAEGALCPVGVLKSLAAQNGTTTAARLPDLPIRMTIHGWNNPNDKDVVMVEAYAFKEGVDDPAHPELWAWEEFHSEPAPPAATRPNEWDVTIPAGKFVDLPAATDVSPTQWKFQSSGLFDGNVQFSKISTVFIDSYSPFHNKNTPRPLQPTRIDFPLAATAQIDTAYLGTIATTGMEFTLPVTNANWDYKPTDKAFIYLTPTLRPTRQLTPVLTIDPVPADGKIAIPVAEIAKLSNGTVWLIMAYEDAAGNRSPDMLANSRPVNFVPLPIPAPPIIDAASGPVDYVIDLADVRFYLPGDVPIKVSRPLNTQDTDRATVFFEGFETLELTPPSQEFGAANELTFTVKWADLKLIYTTLTGGDPDVREVNAPVRWTWVSGTRTKDSPPATPDLDFSYPGEENIDEPDLINKALAKVQLRGVDGILNMLTPPDLIKDPDVVITLPTGPGALGSDVVCTWFYNGRAVQEFSPAGLTQFIGKLPAQRVVDGGAGAKLTYWSFSYIGGVNSQRCLDETVTVTTVVKVVPVPVVSRLYIGTTINCSTLGYIRGVMPPLPKLDFTVPANPALAGLQSITMHWTGTTDAAGLNPIAGTGQDITVAVTGNEATAGFKGEVAEYLTKIKPIQTRPNPFPQPPPAATYGALRYTAVWTDGTRTTSNPAVYLVSIVNGNLEYCDEVRPAP
jgi:hypothetical protein